MFPILVEEIFKMLQLWDNFCSCCFFIVYACLWKGCRLHVCLHWYSLFSLTHLDKNQVEDWKVRVIDSRSQFSLIYILFFVWWSFEWTLSIVLKSRMKKIDNIYKKKIVLRRDRRWGRKAQLYMMHMSPQKIFVSKIIWICQNV